MLLLLVACSTLGKLPVDDTGSAPFHGEGACEGEIYAARSGFDDLPSVLATAHANVFGAAAEPFQEHLGWSDNPSTTVAFVWRTDGNTLATQVQLGPQQTYGGLAEGRSFALSLFPADGRVHEVHVCGLTPGTTYHYRVGGEGHWSDDHAFTTAPTPALPSAFRFAVLGDSRSDLATYAQALERIDGNAPDFYVFNGDAVVSGSDVADWGDWLDVGAGHLDARTMVMVHGNHEFLAQAFFALFAQPGNEQWFSFDYANAHFAVLNDTVADSGDRERQARWLEANLAATTQPWRFTFHHQPMYSSCLTHGSELALRGLWAPVMERGGVAFDFAGHNHNYERSWPLRDGLFSTVDVGTSYVVTAGTGAPLYANDMSEPFTAVAEVTDNFTIVDVDGDELTLTAYDLSGNVIDTVSSQRPADDGGAR